MAIASQPSQSTARFIGNPDSGHEKTNAAYRLTASWKQAGQQAEKMKIRVTRNEPWVMTELSMKTSGA
jgi:hypothetical protein